MTGDNELHCYNRGCGQKFNPNDNEKDVCCHHPGLPFFHDAYKGWSCCNKKVTDFTEFLNIKGCTIAKHSNEKPPELPKSKVDKETANEVVTVRAPVPKSDSTLKRPPFDSPLETLEPNIAEALKDKFKSCPHQNTKHTSLDNSSTAIGTACKNGGCRGTYEGAESDSTPCVFHPGTPIFHEGMKYWSCCQKKTTDFNTFLNQAGCNTGLHKWKKEAQPANTVKCRWDWHQTGSHVVVAVYSKEYHPFKSHVKLNPVRLAVQMMFTNSGDAKFNLDLELRGVVDVKESSVQMLGTKVEIKLKKAEPGSWAKLDFPRVQEDNKGEEEKASPAPPVPTPTHVWDDRDEVDLDDVEPMSLSGINITEVK